MYLCLITGNRPPLRVVAPLVTALALVLTGCGASGSENSSPGSATDTVPVSQTCDQIAPDGGIGAMQDATDHAEDLFEVEDNETAMATSDRARELIATFAPIIGTADDSIRPNLEAVAAVPPTIVDVENTGNQNLNLEFSGFTDAGNAILETCFSDTEDSEATVGTSSSLIGRGTAVEAYCGTLVDGFKIASPSTDVATFGEAWDLVADGQSCDTHDGETYEFAFEEGTGAGGNRVPREEFRPPAEKMWEGFEDAEEAEELVAIAISGDYAADLDALGIVVDDVADYRQFMKRNICESDPEQAGGPGSLRVAVRPWEPEASRLAAAYDCHDRTDEVEEALAAL
jgi:hypothetical protein